MQCKLIIKNWSKEAESTEEVEEKKKKKFKLQLQSIEDANIKVIE